MPDNYVLPSKTFYICIVFFMVLDLRLTKIGCRDDNQFFCIYPISYKTIK